MKPMNELISELNRAEREYPALTHRATHIDLSYGTVEIIVYGCEPGDRALAVDSQELHWTRHQHKNGIDWEGKTGAIKFRFYAMEPVQQIEDKDLGPVCFIPPVHVIEPEDLNDNPNVDETYEAAEVFCDSNGKPMHGI